MKSEKMTEAHKEEIRTLIGYGYTLSAILNLYSYSYKETYDFIQKVKGERKNEGKKS